MIIAVSEQHAGEILRWLQDRMAGVDIIGRVVDNGRKVTHIPLGIEYSHY